MPSLFGPFLKRPKRVCNIICPPGFHSWSCRELAGWVIPMGALEGASFNSSFNFPLLPLVSFSDESELDPPFCRRARNRSRAEVDLTPEAPVPPFDVTVDMVDSKALPRFLPCWFYIVLSAVLLSPQYRSVDISRKTAITNQSGNSVGAIWLLFFANMSVEIFV